MNDQHPGSDQKQVLELWGSMVQQWRSENKWHLRFLDLCRLVSTWSKDPSTKVGAVIVSPDRTDVIIGYNGFPKGMPDTPELLNNREEKYDRIIHAEMNAVLLAKRPLAGYTLYTWPVLPCHRCMVHMIQAGIRTFVAPMPTADYLSRWRDSYEKSRRYAKECQATIIEVEGLLG